MNKAQRYALFSVLFIILVTAILFLPAMLGLKGIFHDDLALEVFPRHFFLATNLQKGILPLWNPHIWCGAIPFCARYYADTYYVILWPFYLMANLKNINHAYWFLYLIPLLLHYILAASGMFFLLRKALRCDFFPAILGALAYIYSPTFVYAYVWLKIVILQAWLPWFLLLYIKTIEDFRPWKLILTALIFVFMLTVGAPNYMPFVIFIWIAVIIIYFLQAVKQRQLKRAFGYLFIAGGIIVLGLALSAVYLLPVADGVSYTLAHMRLSPEEALLSPDSVLPPFYLATLFAPNLFGNITGSNFTVPPLKFYDANMSGGLAVMFLVTLAFSLSFIVPNDKRRYWVIAMAGLCFFAVICMLGDHLPFYRYVIGSLPLVNIFPYPIRYRMIQCFAVAVLVALGAGFLVGDKSFKSISLIKRWAWLYLLISFFIVGLALIQPQKSIYSSAWTGEGANIVDGYLLSREPVGIYSPDTARVKKVGVFFSGPSSGEIRYSNGPIDGLGEKWKRVSSYSVPAKGWFEFEVDVGPGKFIYIYPERGNGAIGYKLQKGDPTSFVYQKVWREEINKTILYLYLEPDDILPASLLSRLQRGSIVKFPIFSSLLYLLVAAILIICVTLLCHSQKAGYLLSCLAATEFFVFGAVAFYGTNFSQDYLPGQARAKSPLEYSMLRRQLLELPPLTGNSILRIASDQPFHDNFAQLNKHFSFMGYEMHPLERRFKYAIEVAYARAMDWPFYEGDNSFPLSRAFLDNFSVGYLLTTTERLPFLQSNGIPLSGDPGFFMHINPGALPRAYTVTNIISVPEQEQLSQLIIGDLRNAVYMDPGDYSLFSRGDKGYSESESQFAILQKKNPITKTDFSDPNRIYINIEVSVPSMLVLTEVWYPGWRATINGRYAKIFRVNYCQRGVWLEKGKQTVILSFRPLSWACGLIISCVTLLGAFAFLILNYLRDKKVCFKK